MLSGAYRRHLTLPKIAKRYFFLMNKINIFEKSILNFLFNFYLIFFSESEWAEVLLMNCNIRCLQEGESDSNTVFMFH